MLHIGADWLVGVVGVVDTCLVGVVGMVGTRLV